MVKVTGTPHPDGSCAWRAGRAGHEDRIGVARNRHTSNPLPEWWAWCGRCDWVPLGPGGEDMHRTWQEAQDAAAAHADRHSLENDALRADAADIQEGGQE